MNGMDLDEHLATSAIYVLANSRDRVAEHTRNAVSTAVAQYRRRYDTEWENQDPLTCTLTDHMYSMIHDRGSRPSIIDFTTSQPVYVEMKTLSTSGDFISQEYLETPVQSPHLDTHAWIQGSGSKSQQRVDLVRVWDSKQGKRVDTGHQSGDLHTFWEQDLDTGFCIHDLRKGRKSVLYPTQPTGHTSVLLKCSSVPDMTAAAEAAASCCSVPSGEVGMSVILATMASHIRQKIPARDRCTFLTLSLSLGHPGVNAYRDMYRAVCRTQGGFKIQVDMAAVVFPAIPSSALEIIQKDISISSRSISITGPPGSMLYRVQMQTARQTAAAEAAAAASVSCGSLEPSSRTAAVVKNQVAGPSAGGVGDHKDALPGVVGPSAGGVGDTALPGKTDCSRRNQRINLQNLIREKYLGIVQNADDRILDVVDMMRNIIHSDASTHQYHVHVPSNFRLDKFILKNGRPSPWACMKANNGCKITRILVQHLQGQHETSFKGQSLLLPLHLLRHLLR